MFSFLGIYFVENHKCDINCFKAYFENNTDKVNFLEAYENYKALNQTQA